MGNVQAMGAALMSFVGQVLVPLSASDLCGGARVVASRLRDGANPNVQLCWESEEVGFLPRGCNVTPLGFALLADDVPLLEVLLGGGADPNTRVGLSDKFSILPLHLAAMLGRAAALRRLLAGGADPTASLASPPPPASSDSLSASDMFRMWRTYVVTVYGGRGAFAGFSGSCSVLNDLRHTRVGDRPLHLAADYNRSGAAVQVLLNHAGIDVNAPNARGRTPLYKACARGSVRCAKLLLAHPQVDVDAGDCTPLFAAIRAESPQLVWTLLGAGAKADGSVRSGSGRTPLQYTVYRESFFFTNRATIVSLLIGAGAVVEPAMAQHVAQRAWYWVQKALEAPAGGGAAAASGGGAPAIVLVAAPSLPVAVVAAVLLPVVAAVPLPVTVVTAAVPVVVLLVVALLPVAMVVAAVPAVVQVAAAVPAAVPAAGRAMVALSYLAPCALLAAAVHVLTSLVAAAAYVPYSLVISLLIGVGAVVDWAMLWYVVRREWHRVRAPLEAGSSSDGGGAPVKPVDYAGAGRGAIGGERGGLEGQCCMCMDRRAVFGFVHADVMHCCLCGECERELRQRRGLACCLICRLPSVSVCRVVAT
ncbi:Tankyrase-1 [Tetrabaena socialis]|uniref:Tankyrase-1 n=1 Tax=Tetrabaena socialis TaxID=47790 RepID=A0A2J8ABK0_9CHLO|nr:Tankyrase-1 [Tetrabaena socialis]|eukprot:PNH09853.1 Tankyrase-1 [Tetrabaena socialis]